MTLGAFTGFLFIIANGRWYIYKAYYELQLVLGISPPADAVLYTFQISAVACCFDIEL